MMLRVDGQPGDDDWTQLLRVNIGGKTIEVPATPMQTGLVVAELRKQLELHRRALLALHNELERLQRAVKQKVIEE